MKVTPEDFTAEFDRFAKDRECSQALGRLKNNDKYNTFCANAGDTLKALHKSAEMSL